ncbi:MAG: serine/threonine-protein kinase [Cyanobacteriota/Melainabacteria group bacterium]
MRGELEVDKDGLEQVSAPISQNLPSDNDPEYFEVSCRLIPLGPALVMIVFCLLVSTFSWMIASFNALFAACSIALQMLLIPMIFFHATRLKIRLSQHGIKVLSSMHSSTMMRRLSRSWNDLHSVRLRRLQSPEILLNRMSTQRECRFRRHTVAEQLQKVLDRGWMNCGFLMFDFKSGGMAPFPLAGFSPEDLETLFIALSRWGDPMSLNPDVLALRRNVLTGQADMAELGGANYTRMWEESLKSQFEVTNFVPLSAGQVLQDGKLKILMLIACGGMSSVYLASRFDGSRVVVKELRVPVDSEPGLADRVHEMFAREASMLARLDHPSIVHVLDHFVESGRDYLVLEYVPGLTLRQHVKMAGAFSQADCVKLALDLFPVIAYLHSQEPPVLHRDLTPDNLILKDPGRELMLVDFGAANEFVGNLTGTLIGKQCYIPPEQFRGRAEPASDVYAACATLYYLLTGQDPEPISASRPAEAAGSDVVCGDLDELVYLCTLEDPGERLKDIDEIIERLRRIKAKL